MARIGFVNRRAEDGPAIEPFHPRLNFFRSPRPLGKRDVEESLGGLGLVGAGCVHRGEGQGAREGWSLLDDWRYVRRNRDDVLLLDEIGQAAKSGTKVLQQLIGPGVILLQRSQDQLGSVAGIDQ